MNLYVCNQTVNLGGLSAYTNKIKCRTFSKKSMQLQLAIFPERTKLINSSIGFYAKDDFVYYLHNGSPIFCHAKEDRNSYRYILANLVVNNICTCSEISK